MADFDTFLSHNSKDKEFVRAIADALRERGLRAWLDEAELIPGRPWQKALEEIIKSTKSALVLFGPSGLGPWEEPEMRACLSEFVNRNLPVIPVLLPGAPDRPDLPLFLNDLTWVDLRDGLTSKNLGRLEWGIRGEKPNSAQASLEATDDSASSLVARDLTASLLAGRLEQFALLGECVRDVLLSYPDLQVDEKGYDRLILEQAIELADTPFTFSIDCFKNGKDEIGKDEMVAAIGYLIVSITRCYVHSNALRNCLLAVCEKIVDSEEVPCRVFPGEKGNLYGAAIRAQSSVDANVNEVLTRMIQL